MEHLPVPGSFTSATTSSANDLVPYRSRHPYDHGPFLSYPRRQNLPGMTWKDDVPVEMMFFHHSITALEGIFQEWFLFGLVHEVARSLFEERRFVRNVTIADAGGKGKRGNVAVVDTSLLVFTLEQALEVREERGLFNQDFYEHMRICVGVAQQILENAKEVEGLDANVLFCVKSVVELVAGLVTFTYRERALPIPTIFGYDHQMEYAESMIERGWCPSAVAALRGRYFYVTTLFYLSKIDRRVGGGGHASCTAQQCYVSHVSTTHSMGLRHRDCDGKCKIVQLSESSQASLSSILLQKDTPILRLSSEDRSAIDIIQWNETDHYTAISHVWIDGLGNAKENALPKCQLQYLHRVVESFQRTAGYAQGSEVLLWLDTFCCPTDPGPAKVQALSSMREVYSNAHDVLVLDAELCRINGLAMKSWEQFARVLTSRWMTRLWTLQEGALATRLWVQFQDGALHLDDVGSEMGASRWRGGHATIYSLLAQDLFNLYRSICTFFKEDHRRDRVSKLVQVRNSLRYRSVSEEADEPLCLGTLLRVDVGTIANRKGRQERMQEFWRRVAESRSGVIAGMIFYNGPRLQSKGYRWAPLSLLKREDGGKPYDWSHQSPKKKGVSTEAGLVVNFEGFIVFPAEKFRKSDCRYWKDQAGTKNESLYLRSSEGQWYVCTWDDIYQPYSNSMNPLTHDDARYGIILDTDVVARNTPLGNTASALYVTISKKKLDVIHVRKRSTATFDALSLMFPYILEASRAKVHSQVAESKLLNRASDRDGNEIEIDDDCLNSMALEVLEKLMAPPDQIKDNIGFVKCALDNIIAGRYGEIETVLPSTQAWCVD